MRNNCGHKKSTINSINVNILFYGLCDHKTFLCQRKFIYKFVK